MNPQDLPKGQSAEMASLDGRKPQNPPGVYRHEAASANAGKPIELIILPDPKTTAPQDALVRLGFVWVGPAPTQVELRDMQAKQAVADLKAEKAGESPEPYAVPGTQELVFNGTATDVNGPGDALAAKDAEIARLQTLLDQSTAPVTSELSETPVEPEVPEVPAEQPAEVPAEAETPAEDAGENQTKEETEGN